MARSDPQVNLRIPQELKDALEESAAKNGRSLTAEIIEKLQTVNLLQSKGAELEARAIRIEALAAERSQQISHLQTEIMRARSEMVKVSALQREYESLDKYAKQRQVEIEADRKRLLVALDQEREKATALLRELEVERRYRAEETSAEIQLHRSLAERFRKAADLSDDFRALVAALALRALGAHGGQLEAIPDQIHTQRMLLQWLTTKELRGAVYSIVALFEAAGADLIEDLRNMAMFLEDMGLDVVTGPPESVLGMRLPRPELDAAEIAVEMQSSGNLNLKGDPEAIKAVLQQGGITNFIPMKGGIQVAVPQSEAAAKLFLQASRPAQTRRQVVGGKIVK